MQCHVRENVNSGKFLEIFREAESLSVTPGKPGNHPGPGDDIEAAQPEEHLPSPGHLSSHHPLSHRVLHLYLSLQGYPAPTSLVFNFHPLYSLYLFISSMNSCCFLKLSSMDFPTMLPMMIVVAVTGCNE